MSDPVAPTIAFARDDAYLRELFLQWLVFRSRRQRWVTSFAAVLVVIGAGLLLSPAWHQRSRLSASIFVAVGLYGLLSPSLKFRRWRKLVLDGRKRLPDLLVTVVDGALWFGETGGPAERLDRQVRVWRGTLLSVDTTRHVYLPDRWARRADVQHLLGLARAST